MPAKGMREIQVHPNKGYIIPSRPLAPYCPPVVLLVIDSADVVLPRPAGALVQGCFWDSKSRSAARTFVSTHAWESRIACASHGPRFE